MQKILVTSIGSAAGEFVINSYKQLGYRVIGTDINEPHLLYNAQLTDGFYKMILSSGPEDYLKQLLSICSTEHIDYLIPLTDPEVDILSDCHTIFQNAGTSICIEKAATIKVLRNKANWANIFKNDPVFKTIQTCTNFSSYLEDCGIFPLIAKPATGRSSEGFFKASHIDELPISVQHAQDYIFQPWLSGEVVVSDILSEGSTIHSIISRKEWIRTKNGMGVSVEVFADQALNTMIQNLLLNIPFNGAFNIECICHYGEYYLMDINPRFSAGIAFSGLAGYDFAENHLLLCKRMICKQLFSYPSFFAVKQYQNHIMIWKESFK